MLQVSPINAGQGYTYLTGQVAAGVEDFRPGTGVGGVDYYASGEAAGERAGVWLGGQAQAWGLAGTLVTEEQMGRLVGLGQHPETGVQLGQPFRVYRSVEQRLADLDARAEAFATPEDLEAARDRVRRGGEREARGGFDVTLSAPKTLSVLWAAAGSPEAAEAVWAVHRAAVEAAVARLEADAGLTRAGAAGVRQIDAGGFAAMAFEHRTSREMDPQIHTHVVVANRVLGADGVWRSLDSRALFRASTAASAVYDATLWAEAARVLGVRVEPVPGTGRYEVAGVDGELVRLFSTRREQILAALGDRLDTLTGRVGYRVRQVVTLATRPAKPTTRVTSNQLREEWQQRMADAGHSPGGVWDAARVAAAGTTVPGWTPSMVDRAVRACAENPAVSVEQAAAGVLGRGLGRDDRVTVAALRRVLDAAVPGRTVDAALRLLEDEKGHFTAANAANAVARVLYLHPHLAEIDGGVDATVRELTGRLLADPRIVALTPDDPWQVPAGLRRRDGSSVYARAGDRVYTTSRVLRVWEGQVLAAAGTPGATTYTPGQVDAAVVAVAAATGGEIGVSVEQQAALVAVLGRDSRVRALLGAAGAGKTQTLRVAVAAAAARGLSVVGLAPSQVAANVLAAATGMVTANTEAFLTAGSPAGRAARDAVRPGTLVVVDEAGMVSTRQLWRVVQQVMAAGGDLLLVGDDQQLGSVGAGGMLAAVAGRVGAPTLREVRRFEEAWEGPASLRLRAGDVGAVAEYARHGRVAAGSQDDLLARFTAATAADLLAGRSALLVAGSTQVAAVAATGVRALLVAAGRVDDIRTVTLADQTRCGVGDLVVTRRNDHPSGVANRDVWRVVTVTDGGGLRVTRTGDGESRTLAPGYVAAQVQLAYAGTVHAAQGCTVDVGRVLVGVGDDRHLLYVGLTRGRQRNEAGAVVDPGLAELRGWLPTQTGEQLLAEVAGTSRNAVSATDTAADQIEQATSMARLAAVHRDLAALSLTGGHDGSTGVVAWVRQVAPTAADRLPGDPALGALTAAVAAAARRGIDPRALVHAAATARPLDDVADVAAVLAWRITRMAGLLPTPTPTPSPAGDPAAGRGAGVGDPGGWLPALLGPSPTTGSGLETAAADVAAAAAARVTLLGQRVLDAPPAWAAGLGTPPPVDADPLLVDDWRHRAGTVAAYRELVGRTDPVDPIGPPPRDPDTRRAWTAADAALAGAHLPGRVWRAPPGTLAGLVDLAAQAKATRPDWVADTLAAAALAEAAAHLAVDEARVTAAIAAAGDDPDQAAATATALIAAETVLAEAAAERGRLADADHTARAWGAAHRGTLLAGAWAGRLLPHRDPAHTAGPDPAAARRLLAGEPVPPGRDGDGDAGGDRVPVPAGPPAQDGGGTGLFPADPHRQPGRIPTRPASAARPAPSQAEAAASGGQAPATAGVTIPTRPATAGPAATGSGGDQPAAAAGVTLPTRPAPPRPRAATVAGAAGEAPADRTAGDGDVQDEAPDTDATPAGVTDSPDATRGDTGEPVDFLRHLARHLDAVDGTPDTPPRPGHGPGTPGPAI